MPQDTTRAEIERYIAWGYEILPNGVVRDPSTGAEVDAFQLTDNEKEKYIT